MSLPSALSSGIDISGMTGTGISAVSEFISSGVGIWEVNSSIIEH
jgi:hypothetical protein